MIMVSKACRQKLMLWGTSLAVMVLLGLALTSCGSKKSPTGGPVDTIKPEVLVILPQEYAQIQDQIEISFSKPMDRSSFQEGLYFYPPIQNKRISYAGRTLKIKIGEKLLPDTNYYLTLSTRIKDLRGNSLAQNQSYVFANGRLQEPSLSGNIDYENPPDRAKALTIDLYSADSLWVLSHTATGSSYKLDALNPGSYWLKAFLDKNANGRYDFAQEPFCEARLQVRGKQHLDLSLAYQDSSMVEIRQIRPVSNRELEIQFNKAPVSLGDIVIQSVTGKRLPILIKEISEKRLSLITAEQDSTDYRLLIKDLADNKKNINKASGARFRGSLKKDEVAPLLMSSNPRHGTSVNSLQPVLELSFSKIIPRQNMQIKLISTDTLKEVPLDVLSSDSRIYRFKPRTQLINYRSYQLIVQSHTQDVFGNKLGTDLLISFLPLVKE